MKIRSERGFALIEVAIAIAVMGVIFSILFPIISSMQKSLRMQKDHQKYERICFAIASYVSRNARLPTPANDTNSGESVLELDIGFIPFKTLGLSKDCTTDSSGKKIYYIPNQSLTNSQSITASTTADEGINLGYCSFCGKLSQSNSKLDVRNPQGFSLTDLKSNTDNINPVAFVLYTENSKVKIVHGETIIVSLSKESPDFICIFREDLMSFYARNPCPASK